mmetsp:Transcript_81514/g.186597  ORF Transcript_81514/g.186597 Transcript_81514/m.186597 type:complete len:292 (-) Transcript_81514:398-1273(-)
MPHSTTSRERPWRLWTRPRQPPLKRRRALGGAIHRAPPHCPQPFAQGITKRHQPGEGLGVRGFPCDGLYFVNVAEPGGPVAHGPRGCRRRAGRQLLLEAAECSFHLPPPAPAAFPQRRPGQVHPALPHAAAQIRVQATQVLHPRGLQVLVQLLRRAERGDRGLALGPAAGVDPGGRLEEPGQQGGGQAGVRAGGPEGVLDYPLLGGQVAVAIHSDGPGRLLGQRSECVRDVNKMVVAHPHESDPLRTGACLSNEHSKVLPSEVGGAIVKIRQVVRGGNAEALLVAGGLHQP